MRFAVATLDVVGNDSTGWEVNDQHQIGAIDISQEAAEDDQSILNVLNQLEYLDNATLEDVGVFGEDLSYLQVIDAMSGRPLLALILEQ